MKNHAIKFIALTLNLTLSLQLIASEDKLNWKTKDLYCSLEVQTYLMDKERSEESFQIFTIPDGKDWRNPYVKIPLTQEENRGSSYGSSNFRIEQLNATLEISAIFKNFESFNPQVPTKEKDLSLHSRLIVDDQVIGAGSGTKQFNSLVMNDAVINVLKIHTIEDETINRFRFKDPNVRMSYEDAAKKVYPNKKRIIEGATVTCTAFSWK